MRNFLSGFALAIVLLGSISAASADVMDVNVTQVDPRFREAFVKAERFWEERLVGYSDALPPAVKARLTKLRITASTPFIDGPGGVLGNAAPTSTITYGGFFVGGRKVPLIAIAQESEMRFDSADLEELATETVNGENTLELVVRHEMAHALGFGSLWTQNELIDTGVIGLPSYIGQYGLTAYRRESGNTFLRIVPLDNIGGAGTAASHWDALDPFFNQPRTNRSELMIGYLDGRLDLNDPDFGTDIKFISETSWASFADLWFKVERVNAPRNVKARPVNPWVGRAGDGIFTRRNFVF